QIDLDVGIDAGQVLLKSFGRQSRISAAHFAEARQQPDRLNDFFFLQGNRTSGPGATTSTAARPRCPPSRASNGRYAADRRSTRLTTPTGMRAFRRRNQLQQLLRIVQPIFEFWSKALRRNLRCDRHVTGGGVRRYELDFVDANRGGLAVAE